MKSRKCSLWNSTGVHYVIARKMNISVRESSLEYDCCCCSDDFEARLCAKYIGFEAKSCNWLCILQHYQYHPSHGSQHKIHKVMCFCQHPKMAMNGFIAAIVAEPFFGVEYNTFIRIMLTEPERRVWREQQQKKRESINVKRENLLTLCAPAIHWVRHYSFKLLNENHFSLPQILFH